ncbi:hypothetical protein XM38_024180 [Halomicronema hongdechloris C2206]|uniref:Uncharacterized protein n=1 Tax=Halomicronema hongdechloris C2206 TaxID=1641165 RepID=A0A1Z3HMJ0_9CYAN|nr:hypothetical protein XM38_024180 [Halomicronema hongdechloris C2206]
MSREQQRHQQDDLTDSEVPQEEYRIDLRNAYRGIKKSEWQTR